MRMLKRNTVLFEYRAYLGKEEKLVNGLHTGNTRPVYDSPVVYRGNISAPSGLATANLFGINTNYTHVLLMDDMLADIREDGVITWKDDDYDVQAVRPTMNVLAVALRKRTKNHAPEDWTPAGSDHAASGQTEGD